MLSGLRVGVVSGMPAVAALAPAWAELAERDPRATPFGRPEWLLPYCRAFGVAEPWAVVLWRGGRLAGLAALATYADGGWRIATLLGGGRSDWQDALVDPELAPDGAQVLLSRIADEAGSYDALLPRGLRGRRAEAAAPRRRALSRGGEPGGGDVLPRRRGGARP